MNGGRSDAFFSDSACDFCALRRVREGRRVVSDGRRSAEAGRAKRRQMLCFHLRKRGCFPLCGKGRRPNFGSPAYDLQSCKSARWDDNACEEKRNLSFKEINIK